MSVNAGPAKPSLRSSWEFAIGVGLMFAFLLIARLVISYHLDRLEANDQIELHSHEVLAQLGNVREALLDAETGQRGYLLTQEAPYLAPYEAALSELERRIEALRALTADSSEQQARIATLHNQVMVKTDELARTVDLVRNGDAEAALTIVRGDSGKLAMDAIRSTMGEIAGAEQRLLDERAKQSQESYRATETSVWVSGLIGALVAAGVFYMIYRRAIERRRDAQLVADERERLQVTLSSIGDAVIVTDGGGRVSFMNAVAENLTGWGAEAKGRTLTEVFQIFNEYTGEPVESPVDKVLREGCIVGLANHTVLVGKDGVRRPIDDSGAPIRVGDNAIGGVVLVFRDISERHAAAAAAAEQARLMGLRADVGGLLASNQSMAATLQGCAEQLVNHLKVAFSRIWLLEEGAHELALAASAGQSTKLDERHSRVPVGAFKIGRIAATGQPHLTNSLETDAVVDDADWAEQEGMEAFAGYPLSVSGRVVGVMAVFAREPLPQTTLTDLAPLASSLALYIERKRAEDELRTLAAHLSEADRRKDEFLAMLAHELRNPLAPLRNGLEVLRLTGDRSPHSDEARAMMERQLGQLVRLVDDLLDVSRITRDKIDLRLEPVDLASIVRSAVETSRPLVGERQHELTVSLPPEPLYLEADATRLAQVFSNLLNNAAKYTEPGGKIQISAERRNGEAVISVRDTGAGIPADMLAGVFNLFTQVDRTLERKHGGLGIGLTVAKRLVELHGGTVEARSEGLGKGSEFVVRLPTVEQPARNGDATAKPKGATRARRVLVVDDNVDSASSLRMMLRLLGHEVEVAHDGLAAVQEAQNYRPDLILLDIGLPRLNGYEACRRIRDQWGDETARPKIVALTGWGQEEDRRRSREAGFDVHLVKPIDLAALDRLLADA